MTKISEDYGYPTASVIWLYVLCGGAIGGIIVGLHIAVMDFSESGVVGIFTISFLAMLFGSIIGLFPSLLTGLWLAMSGFLIKKNSDYLSVAIIGYLSTFIYIVGFMMLTLTSLAEMISPPNLKLLFMVSSVGAISAVIVGKIVLPKI